VQDRRMVTIDHLYIYTSLFTKVGIYRSVVAIQQTNYECIGNPTWAVMGTNFLF